MNIGDALAALKSGRDVCRPGLYLVPCMEGHKIQAHALVKIGERLSDWHPTQEQIYAEDWVIIPLPDVRQTRDAPEPL